MTKTPPTSAAQQVQQLTQQLNQLLLDRLIAAERVATRDEQIKALRNLLAGVGIGQQVQRQLDDEARAPPTLRR